MATEVLAKVQDIPEGKAIVVMSAQDKEIALFKIDGKIFAINNECPHAGGPLGEGDISDCIVTCPWHAWEFNIKTGDCINAPSECVETIPVTIEGDNIVLS